MTPGSFENARIMADEKKLRDDSKEEHQYRTNANGRVDRMTNAVSSASAKILPNYRSYGEAKSNYWKKGCLHNAGTYSEAGLSCCAKAANYTVNDDNIDRKQNELRASG